jgi:hypothetical protein
MSKHIFSKIAKIGEEVRSAEPMKVELATVQKLSAAIAEVDKAYVKFNNDFAKLQAAVKPVVSSGETLLSLTGSLKNDYAMLADDFKKLGLNLNDYEEGKKYNRLNAIDQEGTIEDMIREAKVLL